MDRRRMMMDGKMFSVDFSVSEGAENCFIEIGGKRLSAGSCRIKKGKKILCTILVPAKEKGRIYYNGKVTAGNDGNSWVTKVVSYEFSAQGKIEITAAKNGYFVYEMRIEEEK